MRLAALFSLFLCVAFAACAAKATREPGAANAAKPVLWTYEVSLLHSQVPGADIRTPWLERREILRRLARQLPFGGASKPVFATYRAYVYGTVEMPPRERLAFPPGSEFLRDVSREQQLMGRFTREPGEERWKFAYDVYDSTSKLVIEAKQWQDKVTLGRFGPKHKATRLKFATARDHLFIDRRRTQAIFLENPETGEVDFSFRLLSRELDLTAEHPYLKLPEGQESFEIGRALTTVAALRRDRALHLGGVCSILASWFHGARIANELSSLGQGVLYASMSAEQAKTFLEKHRPVEATVPLVSDHGERDPGELIVPGWAPFRTPAQLRSEFEVWAMGRELSAAERGFYLTRTNDVILQIPIEELILRYLP